MSAVPAITYTMAVAFWIATTFYGLLASREFIAEQFLKPELFATVAIFARYWTAIALAVLVIWMLPRRSLRRRRDIAVKTAAAIWGVAAVGSFLAGAPRSLGPGAAPLGWALTSTVLLWLVAVAESRAIRGTADEGQPNTASDFFACLTAALGVSLIESIAGVVRSGSAAGLAADAAGALRTQVLLAMVIFLVLMLVRAIAAVFLRPVVVEAQFVVAAAGMLVGWYIHRVAMASISMTGAGAAVAAYALGYVIAVAVTARSLVQFDYKDDGVRTMVGGFAPRLAAAPGGFAAWLVVVLLFAVAVDQVTQGADWNFAVARLGVLVTWLVVLGGAVRLVKTPASGSVPTFLGLALVVLAAHVVVDRSVSRADAMAARSPATRWAVDLLKPADERSAELFAFLLAHTNIAGASGRPVEVAFAPLAGGPSALRPHIFMIVVDSLRRDYLSAYNPAVSFTPSIDAFAQDSLVFERAFTQYGATGLSVPSIWIGGLLLHKQYVTPFAPMNTLARLLQHEQYAQWLSMDNILELIVPPSAALEPLDRGVAVKDFRLCRTLEELRGRLASRAPAAPIFAYSLPQDIHVSVITREGAGAVDAEPYGSFYAPVASRIRRLDSCFGAFITDLKQRGLYDDSIIILTSDHGDSLGEEGRIGHAYALNPEIARVPMIVRVPHLLRERFGWQTDRVSYTTDLAPTLYRLLGHEVASPGEFYGESLARPIDATLTRPRDRMIAASYGSVYGAVMQGGTRLYVADAIERRERAFAISSGAEAGRPLAVSAEVRQSGADLIRRTVEAIARAYGFEPP